MGRGRVVIVGDGLGRVEALLEAELVLDLLLGSLAADEFLGVGVVPTGEAEFGGGAVGMREEERRRSKEWELGLQCRHQFMNLVAKRRGFTVEASDSKKLVVIFIYYQF